MGTAPPVKGSRRGTRRQGRPGAVRESLLDGQLVQREAGKQRVGHPPVVDVQTRQPLEAFEATFHRVREPELPFHLIAHAEFLAPLRRGTADRMADIGLMEVHDKRVQRPDGLRHRMKRLVCGGATNSQRLPLCNWANCAMIAA